MASRALPRLGRAARRGQRDGAQLLAAHVALQQEPAEPGAGAKQNFSKQLIQHQQTHEQTYNNTKQQHN